MILHDRDGDGDDVSFERLLELNGDDFGGTLDDVARLCHHRTRRDANVSPLCCALSDDANDASNFHHPSSRDAVVVFSQ